jgi:hypothetical protein
MPRPTSAIPVGTQFSPDLVNLKAFCAELIAGNGVKDVLEDRVWQPNVRIAKRTGPPTRRGRSLPLESARQYGLLNKDYSATQLAEALAAADEDLGIELFGRHILLECGGLRVVEAAQQMQQDQAFTGVRVTGDTLAAYLTAQGFTVIEHNTAINSLRMWLANAGIFKGKGWQVDENRKRELLGLDDMDIATLVSLPSDSAAMAIALCRIKPTAPVLASEVRELAEVIEGRRLGRSSLPKLLEPLKVAGLIDFKSGGTRSGKSAKVWLEDKFNAEVLEPFLTITVYEAI